MEINKENYSDIKEKKNLDNIPIKKLRKKACCLITRRAKAYLRILHINFFFFYFIKVRLQVTIKTAKMLPKTDQSSDTSIKSSGNTLFHIYFASNSSVTTLLFASASCCLAQLRPVFIF